MRGSQQTWTDHLTSWHRFEYVGWIVLNLLPACRINQSCLYSVIKIPVLWYPRTTNEICPVYFLKKIFWFSNDISWRLWKNILQILPKIASLRIHLFNIVSCIRIFWGANFFRLEKVVHASGKIIFIRIAQFWRMFFTNIFCRKIKTKKHWR